MNRPLGTIALAILAGCLAATTVATSASAGSQSGKGSYYTCCARTANGEHFNTNASAYTCAHRTLPFGTRVRVTANGRSITCRVNDRGPFIRGRIIDITRAGARALGVLGQGVFSVRISW